MSFAYTSGPGMKRRVVHLVPKNYSGGDSFVTFCGSRNFDTIVDVAQGLRLCKKCADNYKKVRG